MCLHGQEAAMLQGAKGHHMHSAPIVCMLEHFDGV